MAKNLKVKQLYEKVGDEYKEFYPEINLQSILESVTEKSVAFIFHHYNHFNASWTNTQELTRAQVPPQLRRNNLWLSYNNGSRKITERFIGKDIDASIYERWIDSKYWEELDFEILKAGVAEAVDNALNNLDKYPDIKAVIKQIAKCILRNVITEEWIEENIGDSLEQIIQDVLGDAIDNYLHSDEFKVYFKEVLEEMIGGLLDEYFRDIQQALWDEERVIANALARHEAAITELQNKN